MKELSTTEVVLESPKDVEKAIEWCEEHGAIATVFFVGGYKDIGRCASGIRPVSLIARMKNVVAEQPDLHARVGEALV